MTITSLLEGGGSNPRPSFRHKAKSRLQQLSRKLLDIGHFPQRGIHATSLVSGPISRIRGVGHRRSKTRSDESSDSSDELDFQLKSWDEYSRRPPRSQRRDRRERYNRPVSHLRGRARSLSPRTHWMEETNWGVRKPHSDEEQDLYHDIYLDMPLKSTRDRRVCSSKGEEQRRKSFSTMTVKPPTTSPSVWREPMQCYINNIAPDDALCQTCRMVNAERIISKTGYRHLPLADLKKSSRSCHFCYILRKKLHLAKAEIQWSNKLRIYLKGQQILVTKLMNQHLVAQTRNLSYFTDELDPATDLGVPWRRRLTDTRSNASFDVARSWLTDCCANQGSHVISDTTKGQKQSASHLYHQFPTRLIDLGSVHGSPEQLALKDTQTIKSKSYTYCTLSYCWGKQIDPSWITTKSNLQHRQVGFDRSELPPTLYDATFIAQQLGLRYIWIDAICIVQDDNDDWVREGSKMAGIYRGSQLTIAVALGHSSTEGAFNEQSTSHLEVYVDLVRLDSQLSDGRHSTLYFDKYINDNNDPYRRHVLHGPLSTRAWCLQETLLSSRILYYTQSQLLWRCNHLSEREDRLPLLPLGVTNEIKMPQGGAPALTTQQRVDLWYRVLVPQYATRQLARGSDKLVAISALAEAVSLNSGAKYIAGLWRDSLMVGLLWGRKGPGKKTLSYRCPSWSWASQDSAISYFLRLGYERVSFDASIIAVEVDADQHNQFGAVSGGFLKLFGRLICRGIVMRTPTEQQYNPEQSHVLIFWDNLRPISTSHVWIDDDDLKLKEVICIYLGHFCALILEDASEGKGVVYRRIGILHVNGQAQTSLAAMWKRPFADAPRCLLTII
ncbi:heterokaryon incompatibility protein-domain-containing protein [Xylaria sp. FL1042]|nr:heterokaryon incompatibility protein-domain-containing protein [Xylaria sp. FL1042]